METALQPVPVDFRDDPHAADLIPAALSASTRAAYLEDWRAFQDWAAAHGLQPLPAHPYTLTRYLNEAPAEVTVRAGKATVRTGWRNGGLAVSTLARRLTVIGLAHRTAGLPDPTALEGIRLAFKGLRNIRGTAQRQAAALTADHLRQIVPRLDQSLQGLRDRALLLLGFCAALRRSELAALDVQDLEDRPEGLAVAIRRSKTDQQGAGAVVPVCRAQDPALCPVAAVRAWIAAAGIASGPVFRPVNRHGKTIEARLTDQSVALIVKRAVAGAGLDPAGFSGHSLRAGCATTAAMNDATHSQIKKVTRHASDRMVSRYIRDGQLFKNTAATKLGL